jgi:outer membrane protein assembly factor BamB
MSERDPFATLGELVDQPVAPNAQFGSDLKAQLMSELSAGNRLREKEHALPMDTVLRPPIALLPERPKRTRRIVLFEIAAVAALLIGIVATYASGWFSNDPEEPPVIPAAVLQEEDSDATPVAPALVLNDEQNPAAGWELTLLAGESVDYGGMAAVDGTVYRLLATPSFVGVEAVDGPSATVLWRSEWPWSNHGIAAGDGVFFFSGPSEITALEREDGSERWVTGWEEDRAAVSFMLSEGWLYVWDTTGTLTAIDTVDGEVLWATGTGEDSSAQVAGTPAMTPVAGGGWVAVVTGAGNLTVFDRNLGEIVQIVAGFDPVNSQLAAQPPFLFVLGGDPEPVDGAPNLRGAGVNAETGEIVWEMEIGGPLISPVGTHEEYFAFIADGVWSGAGGSGSASGGEGTGSVNVSIGGSSSGPAEVQGSVSEVMTEGSPVSESGTVIGASVSGQAASDDSPAWGGEQPAELTGGRWVVGVKAATGVIVWQRETQADGFAGLATLYGNAGGLDVYTSDGYVVGIARDSGAIVNDPGPQDLDRLLLDVVADGSPQLGFFATTIDGSLIWFGALDHMG